MNPLLYHFVLCSEFQSRVGRATMQQLQEDMMNPAPTTEDQRATLGDLKARGKLQKVGTNRIGAAKLGRYQII